MNRKIMDLDLFPREMDDIRVGGNKIVHCHGVFDLLHIGHIKHFQEARALGDVLVVTITPDKYVNKGEGRPVFPDSLRAEAIAALDCVDYVAVNRWPTAVNAIKIVKPDFYVKGPDYKSLEDDPTGGILLEEEAIKSVGGELSFTGDITFSSSHLINQHFSEWPEEVREYISELSNKYSYSQVMGYLDSVRSLKVLTMGETIIDEYVYCETMGKSGKEPVLASRQIDCERFAGGIIAIANNVASFSDTVGLLTFLGTVDSHKDFIEERINPDIDKTFLWMDEKSRTILKRRFVEKYPFQKLFELYVMDKDETSPLESMALLNKLEELLPNYDMVLVADYGHGMIGKEVTEYLCAKAPYLAVNTQVNAGNMGFNTVSKYQRADLLCVSEKEIRLEVRSKRQDLRSIIEDVSKRLSCDRIIITRGPSGCLCYCANEGFFEVPAFAKQVRDRVGAGDAVFALSSMCAAKGIPIEIVGLIGNLAGAQAVNSIGHRDSLEREPVLRQIDTLLK